MSVLGGLFWDLDCSEVHGVSHFFTGNIKMCSSISFISITADFFNSVGLLKLLPEF